MFCCDETYIQQSKAKGHTPQYKGDLLMQQTKNIGLKGDFSAIESRPQYFQVTIYSEFPKIATSSPYTQNYMVQSQIYQKCPKACPR